MPPTAEAERILNEAGSTVYPLPEKLKKYAFTEEAYVTTTKNSKMVLFVQEMGKGRNMRGYVYTKTPILSSQIEVNSVDFAKNVKHNCKLMVDVDQNLGDSWYEVSYWLD